LTLACSPNPVEAWIIAHRIASPIATRYTSHVG
jgi:hypothetical protein